MGEQRQVNEKIYLRILDMERDVSSNTARQNEVMAELKAEIFRELVSIHKNEIELKERSNKGIWQTATLMSRLVGGTETEWAKPFLREPRQFTLENRQ